MNKPHITYAPWTDKQVETLNKFQQCGFVHPYTCGGKKNGKDCRVDLLATKDGWVCPECCGYEQTWAHTMSCDPESFEMMSKSYDDVFKSLNSGSQQLGQDNEPNQQKDQQ